MSSRHWRARQAKGADLVTGSTANEEPAADTPSSRGIHVPVWVVVVVGGLIVLGLGFGVARWTHDGERRRFEGRGDFGGHGGRGLGIVVLLVLIALIVLGVVLLYRHFGDRRQGTSSAESVLAGRFARGEIDAAEFRERRDALRESDRS
jgi:putative membrane protein